MWNAWANLFIPRHSVPEVLITDNGKEFCAKAWTDYLKKLGVEHRRTTPVHPQSNGRVERFNRTLKEMLAKAVNNYTPRWEEKLGDCLTAYRNSVSAVTCYTPFFLLYGRRSRMPLTRLLPVNIGNYFGNRLDDLAVALRMALNPPGTAVAIIKKDWTNVPIVKTSGQEIRWSLRPKNALHLLARWDPQWEVTRVRGPVVWIRQQQTGKNKVLNQEKVRLVDPEITWEDINP